MERQCVGIDLHCPTSAIYQIGVESIQPLIAAWRGQLMRQSGITDYHGGSAKPNGNAPKSSRAGTISVWPAIPEAGGSKRDRRRNP
jgi:hypothetical protein